jgi:hypothetical protein
VGTRQSFLGDRGYMQNAFRHGDDTIQASVRTTATVARFGAQIGSPPLCPDFPLTRRQCQLQWILLPKQEFVEIEAACFIRHPRSVSSAICLHLNKGLPQRRAHVHIGEARR